MAIEVKSPSKPKPTRGSNSSELMRANKQYSFKNEHVVSLFNLFHESNKLKLSEVRHPEEIGKKDDSNYYLYHKMLGHPMRVATFCSQVLIDADVLKLGSEQKKGDREYDILGASTIWQGSPISADRSGFHPERRTKGDQW